MLNSTAIARSILDDNSPADAGILADALIDEGCCDEWFLTQIRSLANRRNGNGDWQTAHLTDRPSKAGAWFFYPGTTLRQIAGVALAPEEERRVQFDAQLAEANATRRYLRRVGSIIREAADCKGKAYPIDIVPGDAAPHLTGDSFYWTTPGGTRIRHPGAYRWNKVYHNSTLAITVGRRWLSRRKLGRRPDEMA